MKNSIFFISWLHAKLGGKSVDNRVAWEFVILFHQSYSMPVRAGCRSAHQAAQYSASEAWVKVKQPK
jgi:hypothetical protein